MKRSMWSRMVRRMVSRSKLSVSDRASLWNTSRSSRGMRFSVSLVIRGPMNSCGVESYSILSHTDACARKRDVCLCDKLRDHNCECPVLRSTADVNHRSGGFQETRFADMMARFLLLNGTENILAQFRLGSAGAHAPVKVVLDLRKKAGADLAVGSQP